MKSKENTRYIYIRSTKERVPVTEKVFHDYYREINTFRKNQQRHRMCVCPASKRLDCDMDCATCPFRRAGAFLSLNKTVEDEDGNEVEWGDLFEDPSARFDEVIADSEQLQQLLHRLSELMPEAIEVGNLRLQGLSDRQIAKRLGVLHTTLDYRMKKLKAQMQKEFPEIFKLFL